MRGHCFLIHEPKKASGWGPLLPLCLGALGGWSSDSSASTSGLRLQPTISVSPWDFFPWILGLRQYFTVSSWLKKKKAPLTDAHSNIEFLGSKAPWKILLHFPKRFL